MIPLYEAQEERIEVIDEARRWSAAGIVSPEQAAAVRERYRPAVVRVNFFLRLLLAVFTGKAAGAMVVLPVVAMRLEGRGAGLLLLLCAPLFAGLADRVLIGRRRFYRCGVEEALLGLAVACGAVGPALLLGDLASNSAQLLAHVAVLGGAVWLALRYGYALAAFGAVAAWGALPFHVLEVWSSNRAGAARPAAWLLLAGVALAGHLLLSRRRAPLPRGYVWCLETARLTALAGVYFLSNSYLHREYWGLWLGPAHLLPWPTAADLLCALLTASLPAAALVLGIRGKDRALLWFGGLSAVASVLTLKYFFHLGYLAEELTLAGLAVGGTALGLLGWLRRGPGRQ